MFSDNPAVGFLSHAQRFSSALADGKVLTSSKNLAEISSVVFNDYVGATLVGVLAAVVVALVVVAAP